MAVQTQTVINRQDPEIEAYRLGLLGDTQGLVRDQIFGQNVQNLRDQGLSDEDIAERLGRDVADVGNISQDQLFGCLLYTSPSPRDRTRSRMPSSA